MKIVVTGAPGWLGNRFVDGLLNGLEGGAPLIPNADVTCLSLPGADASRIESFGAQVVSADLTNPDSIKGALDGADVVVHAAGIIHPGNRTKNLFRINTEGTKHLLDESIRAGVGRFVMVSSNSVAGTNKNGEALFDEQSPANPYMKYGKSKHLAEQLVWEAHNRGDIEGVVTRPCWFYGPEQPERQTRFFNMIQKGNPLVFGKGNNLRSMSYVDNTSQGLALAATKEAAAGQTYWLADERPYSTLEIYETVADILEVPASQWKPRHVPALSSAMCRLADRTFQMAGLYQMEIHVVGEMDRHIACRVDKAKRELGYKPTVGLREGMELSIAWCREHGLLPAA